MKEGRLRLERGKELLDAGDPQGGLCLARSNEVEGARGGYDFEGRPFPTLMHNKRMSDSMQLREWPAEGTGERWSCKVVEGR